MVTANGTAIREPRVWDVLSRHGKRCVVLGVPQTYPPKPLNGCMVADFLAPDSKADYTYPKALKRELERALGEYVLDVRDFRTVDKASLITRIHTLMENRFAAARWLMANRPWDFFMMVEMGMDRLHHGFWKYCDPEHPKYEPGNPFEGMFLEYYRAVDTRIGELLTMAGDDTAVMVVSDHGAKALHGGVCVNQWLVDRGYLVLRNAPREAARIEDCEIDWSRTRAWAAGGYYARVFLNVKGREPSGAVKPSDCEALLSEIAEGLSRIEGPDGKGRRNQVLRAEAIYERTEGVPPDLLVYFGELHWRAVGKVGVKSLFTEENDTGPDDANHDMMGIFILNAPEVLSGKELTKARLLDISPTILRLLQVPIPADLRGQVIG
jgi:predicted AlkP superfamily phosphohydrolase/phosphomutase